MPRLLVLVLSMLIVCGAAPAAEPESPVLAGWTASGGLTPWGPGLQQCRVRENGSFECYEQRNDKKKDGTDGWTAKPLAAEQLAPLRKAIAETKFDAVTKKQVSHRPSAEDGQDVTMTFRSGDATHTLNLWEIEGPEKLPAVAAFDALRAEHETGGGVRPTK